MKKVVLCVLILVLVVAGTVMTVQQRRGKAVQAAAGSPLPAVDIAYPGKMTLCRTVEVYGNLAPKTSTEVKSEILGRVVRMGVKEWDKVNTKALLLEIDPIDFKLSVNKSEAGVKMAKAQLAQAIVDQNRGKREWNRASRLKVEGLITGQELDERRTALESAQAKVALAEAQVKQAEAQLAEARRNLEKTAIYSPIEGTVSQVKVDVGDFLDKGTHLFTIVNNRMLDFTASVPATDLARVAEGQDLSFTVDGIANRSFNGRIKYVNPMVSSADRTGRIMAEVANTDGILRGGVYARGHVVVDEHRDVLVVPKAALMGWDLEKHTARIFIVDVGGVARSREITTGLGGDDMVEVRTGMAGAEQIVIRGGFNLKDGDRVEVAGREGEHVHGNGGNGKTGIREGERAKDAGPSGGRGEAVVPGSGSTGRTGAGS